MFFGREGDPSPLARLSGLPDVELHKDAGWVLAAASVVVVLVAPRGVRTFVVDSVTYRPTERDWFAEWPRACFTGRFGRHEGHFDPGQRIANLVMVGSLIVLTVTGVGLVVVQGGSAFVWFLRVHRWATYVLTPVVAAHVIVGASLLPGYRGVWRAMHLRGRISLGLARRLWPAWAEAKDDRQGLSSLPDGSRRPARGPREGR